MCDQCIEWGGKVWHRYNDGHYVTMVRLHREMWEAAHGPIPPGYHVHHINGDKGDNRLENLELVPHGEHSAIHLEEKIGPYRDKAVRNSLAVRRRNHDERLSRVLICIVCGGEYRSGAKHPTRYCSQKCIEAARSGAFQGEDRLCEHCGNPYHATKRVQRYCSKRCCRHAGEQWRKETQTRNVACAQCGKVFQSTRANARFCCRECALRFHGANRYRKRLS